ncbi:YdcF family protein [Microbacterium sp. SS28]|uniref:YdcF family protein n=1 Tax=Microbacterium sp. SS28 TaxID=2919948 RepID=UPI001FAA8A3B|nr:YdcF family protein [Microbacterium sp. SS28]
MRRPLKRIAVIAASAVAGLIALIIVAGLPLYVFPPAQTVGTADLIYVIGPPQRYRVAVEREMRAEGVADRSLYSVSLHGGWSAERHPICREEAVDCQHPEPYTTKGEIAFLQQYAAANDIDRTIILTFTPHVARTRYILEKCYDGDATVVAVDQHLDLGQWIYQYAYQSVSFVKAWLTPCADASDL